MPKVIGEDQSVYKIITCKKCAAINQYVPSEVKVLWQGCDYSGGPDGAEGFNCAKCGQTIITERW